MEKRVLKSIPYAQAHVEIDENGVITLVSYTTKVITIDPQGWLTCSGLYSMTTRKHIGAFMKEYTHFNYADAKQCYVDDMTLNIYTGVKEFLNLR